MANMDYPGPCPSCAAISGCSTDTQRKSAIKDYCTGLEMELNAWKARMYDTMIQFENASPDNQIKAKESMTMLKSLMLEIAGVLEKLELECPADLSGTETELGAKFSSMREYYSQALAAFSPGWLGG